MAKSTVTIKGYLGRPLEISGEQDRGLMVHKTGKTWLVTHLATGCGIGPGTRLKNDAWRKMQDLHALGVNWTAESLEEIAASAGRDARWLADVCRKIAY